jgi:hypothetical protein
MTEEISVEVLTEQFTGFKVWLEERFARLDDRLAMICSDSGRIEKRVEKLEGENEAHDKRLQRLERLAWLIGGLAAFVAPVVVWAVIEIIKALVGVG